MELNKCTRCGAFHTNSGDVCPKCANRDNLELSTFRKYIDLNGFSSILLQLKLVLLKKMLVDF